MGGAPAHPFEKAGSSDPLEHVAPRLGGDRSPSEGGAVVAGFDVAVHLLRDQGRREGEPGGERLGEGDDVRVEADVSAAEQLAGPPEAGLYLVGDEDYVVSRTRLVEGRSELLAHHREPPLSLDRLDNNRREAPVDHSAHRVGVVVRSGLTTRHERLELLPVLLVRGYRERPDRAPVKRVREGEDLVMSRPALCHRVEAGVLNRRLIALGPAVSKVDRGKPFLAPRYRERQEAPGEVYGGLIGKEVGNVNELLYLSAQSPRKPVEAVAQGVYSDTRAEVEIPFSSRVLDVNAPARNDLQKL